MSAFVPPHWIMGFLVQLMYFIVPIIIGVCVLGFYALKIGSDKAIAVGVAVMIICIIVAGAGSSFLWWSNYEVPSVQEKVVTVQDWQPKAGIHVNEKGLMVIDSADDLMLITTDGDAYLNEENFLFQKFNTRDILNQMKPGGTYKITTYGWREPFNSGFPNILTIEEVVDESHAQNKSVGDYFGTKMV